MTQVSTPVRYDQWMDENGYPTQFFFQFINDLWLRTGGAIDAVNMARSAADSAQASAGFGATTAQRAKIDARDADLSASQSRAAAGSALAVANKAKTDANIAKYSARTAQQAAGNALALLGEARKYVKLMTKLNPDGWQDASLEFALSIGLAITNNATNPNYQVDIDATSVLLVDTNGNLTRATSVNLTVDITASGANGLDTSTEANSTWYHLWVISTGSTTAGLLSASSTAPTMPTGYTYKGYVGAIYNTSGGNFISLKQIGRYAHRDASLSLNAGNSAGPTSVAVEIPTTAKKWVGWISIDAGAISLDMDAYIAADSAGTFYKQVWFYDALATSDMRIPLDLIIVTSQTIWYGLTAGDDVTIYTTGWEF